MSDRLDQLLRQRALLLEHLQWLEAEIAAAEPALTPSPVEEPSVSHDPRPTLSPVTEDAPRLAVAHEMADEIIARYQTEEALKPQDVKRGCLVAFFAVLGLCLAAFILILFLGYLR